MPLQRGDWVDAIGHRLEEVQGAMKTSRCALRRFLISFLTVVLILLAVSLTASADVLERPLLAGHGSGGRLDLELIVDETGDWVANITLEGLQIEPVPGFPSMVGIDKLELEEWTPASLEALLAQMGTPSAMPPLDRQTLDQMAALGVEHLALRERALDGYMELAVYVNNQALVALQASDELVDALIEKQLGAPDLPFELMPPAGISEITVALHFPEGADGEISFADEIASSSVAPINVIEVGATLADGAAGAEIVSLAGLTVEEIEGILAQTAPGLLPPTLATTLFGDYAIDQVDVALGATGLEMDLGDGRWAKLVWDSESRAAIWSYIAIASEMMGSPLQPGVDALIEDLVSTSQVRASVHIAEQIQEGTPTMHLGRPFLVEVDGDGMVYVAGQMAGALPEGAVEPYLPIGVYLDGSELELQTVIQGDRALPYLFVGEGGIGAIASRVSPLDLPWDKIESFVGEMDMSVLVLGKGEGLPDMDLDYEALDISKPAARLVPRIAVDPKGRVGVGEPAILVSGIAEMFGAPPMADKVWPYVAAYGRPGDLYGFTVDGQAIALSLDYRPVVGIRWDPILRQNVIELLPLPPLPYPLEELFPYWKEFATELVLRPQWGIEIKVEEEIAPSALDAVLGELMGLFTVSGG